MAEPGTFERVFEEFGRAFQPLLTAVSSSEALEKFMRSFGLQLSEIELSNAIAQLSTLQDTLEQLEVQLKDLQLAREDGSLDLAKYNQLLQDLHTALDRARSLPDLLKNILARIPATFFQELIDLLIANLLYTYYEPSYHIASIIGLIEAVPVQAAPTNPQGRDIDYLRIHIRWDRLGMLIRNPRQLAGEVYNWGNSEFAFNLLAVRLQRLFDAFNVAAMLDDVDEAVLSKLIPTSTPKIPLPTAVRLPIYTLDDEIGYVEAGLTVVPVGGTVALGDSDIGLALMPYSIGNVGDSTQISNTLHLSFQVTGEVQGGLALALRPISGFALEGIGELPEADAGLLVELTKKPAADARTILLLGSLDATRLQSQALYIRIGASLTLFEIEAGAQKAKVVIIKGDGDGFLNKVLPESPIEIPFDLGVGWSNRKGLYFTGGAGLEINLPVHETLLDVLTIDTIYLALRTDTAEQQPAAIDFVVAVTANLRLGPIRASAERLGLIAKITFPADNKGNLGVANLAIGFKPPAGAGMSLNASAITGGGYLLFDEKKEQYAGILYLEVKDKIAIKAIGLLTTRMPDGRKGFSLLLIITAEFPPIQLGYGFVLIGVGGLLGVNRTMVLDALRAGIKNHTLDSILFPKDPIANAPKIISDLQTVFPPAERRFVFGPMAKIAWGGAYPLLTIELGILIELGLQAGLPASVRLALLGKVTLALPKREKPEDKVIVYINLDILGLIDFDKSDASVDATLFDSRIAEFPITGDMAMRLNWGASPVFVQAAGGFHPRFQPPPNFPALDRLAISIATGENPRIRLESYMALTANTIQFGARLDIYVAYSGFTGAAFLAFDALVEFPFHFVVDIEGGVVIKWNNNPILTATLFLTLSGPGPWRAVGEATFYFLGFKRQLPIDLTSGEEVEPEPLPVSQPFIQLQNQFKDTYNWSAHLPAGEHMAVTLREVAVSEAVLVHPLGSLTVRQTVVPLDVSITKFGNTTPNTLGPFTIEKITFGKDATDSEESGEVRDNFAPAQFFHKSDEEKLGSPAFQPLPAGRTRIGTMQIAFSEKPIGRSLEYDTVVIDALETQTSRGPTDGIPVYAMPQDVLLATAALGAAGQSLLRSTGSATYAGPTDRKVELKDPEYVVVSAEDMSYIKKTDYKPSDVEARQHMAAKGGQGYQVVGQHEVE